MTPEPTQEAGPPEPGKPPAPVTLPYSSPLSFGRDLTVGSIPRHLITFSLPMLAGSALQTAYSFINAIWVGKFLGTSPLAAVTVSFPVVFVLIALGAGLTMATNILISQHYGARDVPSVRRVVESSTLLLGGLSLVLLGVGEVMAPHILRAMDTPPDVLPLAVGYLRIFLCSLPFGFGLFLIRSMLQGIGDSKTPLYFLSASVLATAIMDPILMFGWLGMPRLGLNGTAWASVIAQFGALIALVTVLRRRGNPVAPVLNLRRFDAETAWTTVRIGLPSAVQQGLISIGMVVVTGLVNSFGEHATAAFGAASRVDQLAFMPAMTFSLAIATLTGQNIGAGRHHRVREVFIWGCLLSGGVTLMASGLAVSFPRVLLGVFTNDANVGNLGEHYLRIVGAGYVFFAIMFVSNGIINGAGHTLAATLISLVSLWVVRVPVAWWLSRRMNSVEGIWYSIVMSFGTSMLLSLVYYLSGRWRRPVARRTPMPMTPAAVFGEETGEA